MFDDRFCSDQVVVKELNRVLLPWPAPYQARGSQTLPQIVTAKAKFRKRPCLLCPKSGHVQCTRACLLWAKSGLKKCGRKDHYSITSSASSKNDSRTDKPGLLAVLRLMTSSNFSGDCTGKSAGDSPLRMRFTTSSSAGRYRRYQARRTVAR